MTSANTDLSASQLQERQMRPSSTLVSYYDSKKIDVMREYIKKALDNKSFDIQEFIDLAKTDKEASMLVKELININQVDETELADKIANEILRDIEAYATTHLNKYHKYTLNVPEFSFDDDVSKTKFFNLISLLKDVSILGRKLLEISPRIESFKSLQSNQTVDQAHSSGQKWKVGSCQRDSKSHFSEEDATSDDLLAALIESSSSDDFLVLSSSLDSISMRDMLIIASILITSHECFTLSHDIQGVVIVLRRAKVLIKNVLAPKNQTELIIKLLTSIRRYNEMNYVFDLFRDRNQFEALLSKGVEKTPELRIALFNYVKKNPEFRALVTLNFSMFREIAESLEASAKKRLEKLIISVESKRKKPSLVSSSIEGWESAGSTSRSTNRGKQEFQQSRERDGSGRNHFFSSSMTKSNSTGNSLSSIEDVGGCSSNKYNDSNLADRAITDTKSKTLFSKDSLNICLVEMVDASECYAKAGCYKRSNNCENHAKLIALQIALLPCETNVLYLQESELSDTILSMESFFEAHIIAEAYNYHFAWRQALFRNVVVRDQSDYLKDYCSVYDLSVALIMELVILYKQYISDANNKPHLSHEKVSKLASAMRTVLACLDDIELRCKLYTQLNLKNAKEEMLLNPFSLAYLKDLKLV